MPDPWMLWLPGFALALWVIGAVLTFSELLAAVPYCRKRPASATVLLLAMSWPVLWPVIWCTVIWKLVQRFRYRG